MLHHQGNTAGDAQSGIMRLRKRAAAGAARRQPPPAGAQDTPLLAATAGEDDDEVRPADFPGRGDLETLLGVEDGERDEQEGSQGELFELLTTNGRCDWL
jgi:hypothetical protein